MRNCLPQQVDFWFSPAGGATIALLGVAFTAIATSIWNLQNRKWQVADQKRQVAIEKGEQIYSLIKRWRDFHNEWFSYCALVMENQIDYNQFLDKIIESHENFDNQVDKINFNVAAHFPELLDNWNDCVKMVWAGSSIENRFKDDYKAGFHNGAVHLAELKKIMLETHVKFEILLKRLVDSSRSKLG